MTDVRSLRIAHPEMVHTLTRSQPSRRKSPTGGNAIRHAPEQFPGDGMFVFSTGRRRRVQRYVFDRED